MYLNYKKTKSILTTPDSVSLHKYMRDIKRKKIDSVILEASSHGLHQGRLDGLNFKAGIFTNLINSELLKLLHYYISYYQEKRYKYNPDKPIISF